MGGARRVLHRRRGLRVAACDDGKRNDGKRNDVRRAAGGHAALRLPEREERKPDRRAPG